LTSSAAGRNNACRSDATDLSSTLLFEDEMCLIITLRSNLDGGIDLAVAPPKLVGFPSHYALRKIAGRKRDQAGVCG
jgi:hypothetical protein